MPPCTGAFVASPVEVLCSVALGRPLVAHPAVSAASMTAAQAAVRFPSANLISPLPPPLLRLRIGRCSFVDHWRSQMFENQNSRPDRAALIKIDDIFRKHSHAARRDVRSDRPGFKRSV